MSRSFLSGIVAGTAVSALGLGALSLMAPLPEQTAMDATPAAASEPAPTDAPALEEAATPDVAPKAPEVMPEAAPADAPSAQAVELPAGSEFNKPKPEGEAKLPGTDAALTNTAAASAPEPTDIADGPMPDTTPGQEPQAEAEVSGTMAAPAIDDSSPEVAAGIQEPVLPSPAAPGPTEPAADTTPEAPAAAMAETPSEVAKEETPAAPATKTAPDTAGVAPQVEVDGPRSLRVPVPGAKVATPSVTTGRLPSIGGADAAAEAEAEPGELRALVRYAVPFTPEDGKPLFSVILMDVGDKGLDRSALTTFSFPVTFAVDAARPDAAEAMAAYRAAGYEVILVTGGLPSGATPQDLEVSMQAYLGSVTDAVAVMDAEGGRLQSNRALLKQLNDVLRDSGHGIVTFDKGLNTARQMAEAAEIPNATIFRTLDADRESASTIRRYLDRAAFKAVQDGNVVMLGHSYPDTVTALFSWAMEGKGSDVNLAPVSSVLLAE